MPKTKRYPITETKTCADKLTVVHDVPKYPFTEKGECDDEVTFRFEDKKELYVSKNFLTYMSPVFKRMLQSDFMEKQTGVVNMPGKQYDDVLKFLLAIYPGAAFDFDNADLARLIPLVEEYDVGRLRTICNETMTRQMKKRFEGLHYHGDLSELVAYVLSLLKAVTIYEDQYSGVITEACEGLKKISSVYLVGNRKGVHTKQGTRCTALFESLPADVQIKILANRLHEIERGHYHTYDSDDCYSRY